VVVAIVLLVLQRCNNKQKPKFLANNADQKKKTVQPTLSKHLTKINEQTEIQSKGRGKGSKQKRI